MKYPFIFVVLLWLVKIYEIVFNLDLHFFGIFPLKISGLLGILTSPLVHSGFKHLISNTGPLFILFSAVIYFYRNIALRIFVLTYLLTGFLVWLGAREAYHIGASGLIYGFAAFLFTSGILRNDIRLSVVSLLVVFLYGGMIWGILPLKPQVSWESHLLGLVVGLALAIIYRKEQIVKKSYDWNDSAIRNLSNDKYKITYQYKVENYKDKEESVDN